MLDISTLNEKSHQELKDIAKELGIGDYDKLKKQDLVYRILDVQASQPNQMADILSKQAAQKITIKEKEKPNIMHDPEKSTRPRRKRISPGKKEDSEEKETLNDVAETASENNGDEAAVAEPAAEKKEAAFSPAPIEARPAPAATPEWAPQGNNDNRQFRPMNTPNRPAEIYYDFNGAIVSEGVLETVPEGYGFQNTFAYD